MNVTKYNKGFQFFCLFLLTNTQSAITEESKPSKTDPKPEDSVDYDYDKKMHGNLCNPNMAFRVLRRHMLRGTYNSTPRVERLSNGMFDCNPDGFESVLSQVVGSVQGTVSYGTILSYFGGHSYSDQRVRGLRVVLPYLDQDGSEIRALAKMLKKEEDAKNHKHGSTPGIIKELKKKLPKKIKEEVWGEEEEE